MLQLQVQDNLIHSFLPPNFIIAATTLNLGDQSVVDWHLDPHNLVFGLCGIFLLGLFNHCCLAQLMLLEPRVIIELQHGDFFFLPSACVTHRSAPMVKGETHQAAIFYSAGGLF